MFILSILSVFWTAQERTWCVLIFALLHIALQLLRYGHFQRSRERLLLQLSPVSDAEEACAFKPAASQENHYGKTEFFQQKRVAEIVGGIVSGFYDVGEQKWDVSPGQLKSIVLHNLNAATGTKIYGSAIAFEPGVFTSTAGLEEGVPSKPATGALIASGGNFSSYGVSDFMKSNGEPITAHTHFTV